MSEMDPPSPMSSGSEKNVAVHLSDGGGNEMGSLRNFIRKKGNPGDFEAPVWTLGKENWSYVLWPELTRELRIIPVTCS